jgi:hypothetical protein
LCGDHKENKMLRVAQVWVHSSNNSGEEFDVCVDCYMKSRVKRQFGRKLPPPHYPTVKVISRDSGVPSSNSGLKSLENQYIEDFRRQVKEIRIGKIRENLPYYVVYGFVELLLLYLAFIIGSVFWFVPLAFTLLLYFDYLTANR